METVTKCTKLKEWNGKPIYQIEMSNGAIGESFNQEIPVGTPEDQLVFTSNGTYADKVKWNNPNKPQGGGFKQRSGNESFALSYSKDLVVAGKVDIAKILETADKLYTWLEAKKK